MRSFGMPLTLADIGIDPTPENVQVLYDNLYHSPFVEDTPQQAQRLKQAIRWLVQ